MRPTEIRARGAKTPAVPRTGLVFLLATLGMLLGAACAPAGTGERAAPVASPNSGGDVHQAVSSPLDATFTITDRKFRLIGGRFEQPAAPGSALREVIRAVGKPVSGDLDGDGKEDAALVLAYSGGGSGTFYYAAAALLRDGSYVGTNGVFLGDRIVPRSLEIRGGVIEVGYLDRRPDQPLTAAPTESRTKRLALVGGVLEEVRAP